VQLLERAAVEVEVVLRDRLKDADPEVKKRSDINEDTVFTVALHTETCADTCYVVIYLSIYLFISFSREQTACTTTNQH
jgi:hypothetical protein